MVEQTLELGLKITGSLRPSINYETDPDPELIRSADFFGNPHEEVFEYPRLVDEEDLIARENQTADFFASGKLEEIIELGGNFVNVSSSDITYLDPEEESTMRLLYEFEDLQTRFEAGAFEIAQAYNFDFDYNLISPDFTKALTFFSKTNPLE
ncbi:MAG: hypothetical protein WCK29_02075 [archaeon]